MKREQRQERRSELKAAIDGGMADVAEGRLVEFDSRSIILLWGGNYRQSVQNPSRKKQK